MGWFDEQIKQRKQSDQEVFEDSIFRMASVVLGKRSFGKLNDRRREAKAAVDEILKYLHYKPVEAPDSLQDVEEQLDFCLRPYGLMRRNVKLEPGWHRDAYGPMIGFRRDDKMPVAILPGMLRGYYCNINGEKIWIDQKKEQLFEEEAVCFYRPLPQRKIGIPDLLLYLKDCLSTGDLISAVALSLLVTLVGLILPRVTKMLTGFIYSSGNTALLGGTAAFILSVTAVSRLLSAFQSLMMSRLGVKTSLSVEAAMMMRVMGLPASFFRKFSSGELASRTEAVNDLCDLLLGNALSVGISSVTSLLYITQISRMTPALVGPALLVIAATVLVGLINSLMQIRISRREMEHEAKLSGMSYAMVSGVQKIKLAGAEKRVFARWARSFSEGAELSYNPPLFLKINSAIMTAVSLGGTILIYFSAVKNGVSPSEYMAFNVAYGAVGGAFASLAGIAVSMAKVRPILEMAEPLLNAEPEMAEGKEILTRISGNIELNHVYFRYSENMPYVVDDMSLKIKAGEYVAIVGKTGCGKSTLMRLLLGFEKPERGAVYYDGKDLNQLDLQSLRRRIGVVTQDGSLFQGDIYSNIVISAPQLTLEDAWEAAEIAGIADDIRSMPMGMQTVIGEGQGGISGGQKQRLMIARAIAPKPKILMFDEATSALDNKTQKQVSDALDRMGCTRIIIAHRLSTIRHCDRILVLDQGKILEDGSYEELLGKGGFFAGLVERQRLETVSTS